LLKHLFEPCFQNLLCAFHELLSIGY
jgi:hypothetical protein